MPGQRQILPHHSFLAKEVITEPEPPISTTTATVPETEAVEQPKPQIPPRPLMPPEAASFPKLQKVKVTLDKHNNLIFEAERERTKLEIELSDLKGLARLTKKKELESRIFTQHSIPHSVSPTHIRKNVPNGKKSTEKKPLPNPKPYTERYRGIRKRLTGGMPTNHTEAEIKGRDKSPLVCNFYQL